MFTPITDKTLKNYLNKNNIRVDNYEIIDSGLDYEVCIVNNSLVFKKPRDLEIYGKILKKEKDILNFIKPRISIEIPSINLIEDEDNIMAVYKLIEGKSLDKFDKEEQGKIIYNIVDDIAKFLSELHNIKLVDEKMFNTNLEFRNEKGEIETENFDFYWLKNNKILESYVNDKNKINKIYHLIDETMNIIENINKNDCCIIHNDMHSGNFIIGKNTKLVGIIDFSDVEYNYFQYDFHQLLNTNIDFARTIIEKYNTIAHRKADFSFIFNSKLLLTYDSIVKSIINGHTNRLKIKEQLLKQLENNK